MSQNKKGKGGDYDVGYGKPPKQHQFQKGTSGNLKGPPTKRKRKPIDVAAVLKEPLAVKNSGIRQKMPPFEVGVRQLVVRALKHKNLPAILEFLELCESYGLMVPPPVEYGGGVVTIPEGVDSREWVERFLESVSASSSDADDDDID